MKPIQKIYYGLLLILLSLNWYSCTSWQYANQLNGTWIVDKFQTDRRKHLVERDLEVKMVSFEKEGKCILPARNSLLSRAANWKIYKNGDKYFLSISNAKDTIFNNNFEIRFSQQKRYTGLYEVVELIGNNLYWQCSK